MKVKLLHDEAVIPTRAYQFDAGLDLYSSESFALCSGTRTLARTGICVELPLGTVGLVCPRSGLANEHGVTVLNAPGIVDNGYRGELRVNLINHGKKMVWIDKGTRIAQLVIVPCHWEMLQVVDELTTSERGELGHGSSGV